MRLFKRTLTTAVAVCLALQSAVVCFGAEAEEQIPAGGEEVGLYTSENDEAIQLTEDMYNSWYEGDQTYDGTEKTLYGYSLMDSNNYYRLTEDEDYVVTYENNINVGTATATFTGIGNYTGSFTKNFNIVPADIYSADIDCEYEQSYCAGNPVQPKPIVTYNDIVLAEGVDYEIEYEENCGELGWHYAYIKGIGNFNGTDSFEYSVVEAEISSENISVDTSCTYTGYAQTPAPVVTVSGEVLRRGVDYNVSYTNNVNAGTGYMTIAGMNGYTGYVTVPFTISPKAVSEVEILKIADVDYNGKAVRPSLFVKADGNMVKSSDYTVTYYNNTNVGTATAVVTLGGNYESRYPVSTTFKIVLGKPKGFKATADSTTSVKLSWNKIGNCKYRVYRYDPKKKTYKRLTVTSSTSYTDKKLSEATSYTYAVKLEYNSKTGPYITVKDNTKLSTPKMTVKAYNKKVTICFIKLLLFYISTKNVFLRILLAERLISGFAFKQCLCRNSVPIIFHIYALTIILILLYSEISALRINRKGRFVKLLREAVPFYIGGSTTDADDNNISNYSYNAYGKIGGYHKRQDKAPCNSKGRTQGNKDYPQRSPYGHT